MNRILKTLIAALSIGAFAFSFQSCSEEGKYEERLSLTSEEFEATVIGQWKCVKAGTNYSMDENEEEHIPDKYKIPVEFDYVDITPDAATFFFKEPIPLVTVASNDVDYTTSTINQLTYSRNEATISSDYYFEEDNYNYYGINGYYLVLSTITEGMNAHIGYINPYGKSDKHADRLIISLGWQLYVECERK